MVVPVPPLSTGNAVPESVIASVPDVVIGEPEIERNVGTVAATEVTVPVPTERHVVPFTVKQVERTGPAYVLVPVPETTNQGELPFMRLGEIEPLSVEVADHGVAIAACTLNGSRSGIIRNVLILKSIKVEVRRLGKRHCSARYSPINRSVSRYTVHGVSIIKYDYGWC